MTFKIYDILVVNRVKNNRYISAVLLHLGIPMCGRYRNVLCDYKQRKSVCVMQNFLNAMSTS